MITWLTFKAFSKKVFAWLKVYWYVPIVVTVGALFAWVLQDQKAMKRVLKVMEAASSAYEKEREVIEDTHKKELDGISRIQEQKKLKQQELLKKREREVKEALDKKAERVKILEKEFGKDSDIMKKILEEEFGFHEIN